MERFEKQKFTMDEWARFFDWLTRKYGISEETYHTYDASFCNARENEFVCIAKSYGQIFATEEGKV